MSDFPKRVHWRLGGKLGLTAGQTGMYLGWAVVEVEGPADNILATGSKSGDPVITAVATWRSRPNPRPPVELIRYENAQEFARSRFAREGGTHRQHEAMLQRAAKALRAAGATVYFRIGRV